MVARQQDVVSTDSLDSGEVRDSRRFDAVVHSNAQERPSHPARPADIRRSTQFLRQCLQQRHRALQKIQLVKLARTIGLTD